MLRIVWTILLHLLGLACAAADVAIVGLAGQISLSWTGWLGVGFYWWLALGVAMGWQKLVGQPLSLIVIGFYVMATLALLGLGFSRVLGGPTLLLAFAPLGAALVGRIILDLIAHAKRPKAKKNPVTLTMESTKPSAHDSIF